MIYVLQLLTATAGLIMAIKNTNNIKLLRLIAIGGWALLFFAALTALIVSLNK